MRCTKPLSVGFQADGKTLSWSLKNRNPEYDTFKLPCGKCIECRLDYARQWAVRCVHEAAMHEKNAFITLTYSDEHLGENKLDYRDFQLFMKKLRKIQDEPIGYFCTGEYGDKSKRKHWHAILFNWAPKDGKHKYTSPRGDTVYSSETLDRIWGKGISEYGSVTFHSAGYCARYAAKKLVHGQDDEHDFQPISKKSNKHAIGKKWLEKYWEDAFNHGRIILEDGTQTSIPRYYEKWLKEKLPREWERYVTHAKLFKIEAARDKQDKEIQEFWDYVNARPSGSLMPLTPNQVRNVIMVQKLQLLNSTNKL